MLSGTFVRPVAMRNALLLALGLSSLAAQYGCSTSRSQQSAKVWSHRQKTPQKTEIAAATSSNQSQIDEVEPTQDSQATIELVSSQVELGSDVPPRPDTDGEVSPQSADSTSLSAAHQLSLADLETLALQNNPTLAQAQAAIEVEEGTYRQAGLYPNPQIGYLNGTASNAAVKQSNGVFISQEFVTAHKLALDQQASSQEIKRFQWDREAQCMRVLNDLKIRYYEVLGAQESIAVALRLEKIAAENLQTAERLFNSKQGTRSDILLAKVQLETVQLSLEEAEYRHAAAWEQLATIIGSSPLQPVPLVGDLAGDIPELELEACWQELLSRSPQLRSTESELDHGRAVHRLAMAQAIPNVTVQSVIEYDKATDATTASTLVALPLPLYNRNQGNIDKALADIRTDQSELCRVQLVLRDQLADSFRRYKSSLRQSQRLKNGILPNTEENLKLARQLYVAGETAFAPVLVAQQSNFESQMAYVESLTELHKVVTEINGLQLTGGLNPAAIGSAIQNQPGSSAQRQRALLNEVSERASKQLLPAAQIGR